MKRGAPWKWSDESDVKEILNLSAAEKKVVQYLVAHLFSLLQISHF